MCFLNLTRDTLLAYGSITRQAITAPPRYPAIGRDMALVLDRDVPVNSVVRAIMSIESGLLESVELFDVYEGSSVPQGKKSVALACRYRAQGSHADGRRSESSSCRTG